MPNKKELTHKQKMLLRFIERFQMENASSPTFKEMRKYLKVVSDNAVFKHLEALVKKGYIQKGDTPRSIRALDSVRQKLSAVTELLKVPLLGTIPAGGPVMAEENILGTYEMGKGLMQVKEGCFLLRVTGSSMINAGIHEGDMVLVNPAKEAHEGDIVVALVDGENTVKRYVREHGRIILRAENPDYTDIHPEGSLEVQGVVTGLVRNY